MAIIFHSVPSPFHAVPSPFPYEPSTPTPLNPCPSQVCGSQRSFLDNNVLCFWPHPPEGYVAINCDAAYQPSRKSGGSGVVIRDQCGDVIMCKASRDRALHKYDKALHETVVLRLEMWAILEGLRLAKKLQLPFVQVQSDSKNAISMILGEIPCPQKCMDVLDDIGREVAFFRDVGFYFVYRESNRLADYLSKCLTCDGEKYIDSYELDEAMKTIVMEDACGCLAERVQKRR